MKKGKAKIAASKRRLLLVGFLTFHLLFLVAAKEHLHNHKIDGLKHDNCPVLIINQALHSGITYEFVLETPSVMQVFTPAKIISPLLKPESASISLRAPPTV